MDHSPEHVPSPAEIIASAESDPFDPKESLGTPVEIIGPAQSTAFDPTNPYPLSTKAGFLKPVTKASPEASRTISVYVRKGVGNNQRIITFDRPRDIPVRELLDRGLAIDGNQIAFVVGGTFLSTSEGWQFSGPLGSGSFDNLPDALVAEEKAVIDFLSEHGYAVEFD